MVVINRAPTVGSTKMTGVFDGVDDYARKSDIARDTVVSDLCDANGSLTLYYKFKFSTVGDSSIYPFTVTGSVSAGTSYDQMTFGMYQSGSDYYLGINTKSISTGVITTVNCPDAFTPVVGQIIEAIIQIDASGTGLTGRFWLNSTELTPITNTDARSIKVFSDENEEINIMTAKASTTGNYSTPYNGTLYELKVFAGLKDASTVGTAIPNLWYKFDEGSGNTLTNLGTAGTNYNLALSNITDSTFWIQQPLALPQKDFRYINGMRKAYKFDNVNDILRSAQKTKANICSADGPYGPSGSVCMYARIRLDTIDAGVGVSHPLLGFNKQGSQYVRFIFELRCSNSNTLSCRIVTNDVSPTSAKTRATAGVSGFSVGDIVDVIIIYAGSTSVTAYFNDQISESTTGTLDVYRTMSDTDSDHVVMVGYNGHPTLQAFCGQTIIDLACWNGLSYTTTAECRANLDNAPFRMKCNEGQGTLVNNSGIIGTDYNLTAISTTDSTFHTLLKDK